MKLYVVDRYRNDALRIRAEPGDVLELDEPVVAQLERDAPACFSRKKPPKRQIESAENRMIESAPNRGDRGGGPTMTSGNMPGVSRKGE